MMTECCVGRRNSKLFATKRYLVAYNSCSTTVLVASTSTGVLVVAIGLEKLYWSTVVPDTVEQVAHSHTTVPLKLRTVVHCTCTIYGTVSSISLKGFMKNGIIQLF